MSGMLSRLLPRNIWPLPPQSPDPTTGILCAWRLRFLSEAQRVVPLTIVLHMTTFPSDIAFPSLSHCKYPGLFHDNFGARPDGR